MSATNAVLVLSGGGVFDLLIYALLAAGSVTLVRLVEDNEVIEGRTFDTSASARVAVSKGISLPSHDLGLPIFALPAR
jgi:hypothetical protein